MEKKFSFRENPGTGTLYIVATPIGNLQDITFRAIETLTHSAVIAAEDTRQSRKLLTHFQIEGPKLISYHEHNKVKVGQEILAYLEQGMDVSLISDAGTPAISDPGEDLVRAAIEQGYTVVPIPGVSAAITGLVVSGLPTGQFSFIGFLPRERKERIQEIKRWQTRTETLILYEAPHRLRETVKDLLDVLGDRRVSVARELTKRFEEFLRGTLSELQMELETAAPRGEYVLILAGADQQSADTEEVIWWQDLSPAEHVTALMQTGAAKKDAIKQAAKERNVPKRAIYNAVLDEELKNH